MTDIIDTEHLLVVAGNYREFQDYCFKNCLDMVRARGVIYVSSPEKVMGKRALPYVIIGSAYKLEKYPEIMQQMMVFGHYPLVNEQDIIDTENERISKLNKIPEWEQKLRERGRLYFESAPDKATRDRLSELLKNEKIEITACEHHIMGVGQASVIVRWIGT